MLWTLLLLTLATVYASDPECSYNGQFLPDPKDKCSFFRCGYGDEPWYDSYGNIKYVAIRQSCAPGTASSGYNFNYENPCSEISTYCNGGYKRPEKYGDDYKVPVYKNADNSYDRHRSDGYDPAPKHSYEPDMKSKYSPKTSYHGPSYASPKTSYQEPSYASPKTSYHEPSYASPKTSYHEPSYASPKTSYHEPSYGKETYSVGYGKMNNGRYYQAPVKPNAYDNVDGHKTRLAYNKNSHDEAIYRAPRFDLKSSYQTRTAYHPY